MDLIECRFSNHNITSIQIDVKFLNKGFDEETRTYCDSDRARRCILSVLSYIHESGDTSTDTAALIGCLNTAVKNSSNVKIIKINKET